MRRTTSSYSPGASGRVVRVVARCGYPRRGSPLYAETGTPALTVPTPALPIRAVRTMSPPLSLRRTKEAVRSGDAKGDAPGAVPLARQLFSPTGAYSNWLHSARARTQPSRASPKTRTPVAGLPLHG